MSEPCPYCSNPDRDRWYAQCNYIIENVPPGMRQLYLSQGGDLPCLVDAREKAEDEKAWRKVQYVVDALIAILIVYGAYLAFTYF